MRKLKPQPKQINPDGTCAWAVDWIDKHSNGRSLNPVFAKTAAEAIEEAKRELAASEDIAGSRDWRVDCSLEHRGMSRQLRWQSIFLT